MTERRVLVVGGGIAGLTAAIFAARGGAAVSLLEGGLHLGGRARTREEGGFKFNFGPHALYLGGAAKRTLTELGIDPPGATPALKGAYLVRDGSLFQAPKGIVDLALHPMMSAGDKLAFATANAKIAAGFSGLPGESLSEALNRLTTSLPAQAALKALVRVSTYSNAPDTAEARAVFEQLRLAAGGVRYLHGGWSAMIGALADAARAAGVRIETEARIARLEPLAQGGWRAHRAAGESRDADAIVLAIAPEEAAALTPSAPALAQAAAAAIPVRAVSLDVALTALPRPTHTFALGLDQPTYFSVHSAVAQLAPEGGALIHVSRYLGPEEGPSRAARAELEALLDLMQPGWRDVLAHEQWLPMAHVAHDLPQAARGGMEGRTPVAVAPDLYVAGDWVGAEGMLSDAAFASGRLAGAEAATGAAHVGAAAAVAAK